MKFSRYISIAVLGLWGAGCQRAVPPDNGELRVVATTTIIGDVVAQVGGDAIQLHILIPPGTDPHNAVFRPVDLAQAADTDILFINGARLEGQIDRLLQNISDPDRIVSLDRNIPLRGLAHAGCSGHHHHHDHACDGHDHGEFDPHFWTDPHNVMIWTETIAEALATLRPDQADFFRDRASAYREQLAKLDEWIREQVATLPESDRLLVTDHVSLGYFADRYGFEQAGVILRSFDTMAQPTARDLATLMDSIRHHRVPALFIGSAVNPSLAAQIARDTGTQLVVLQSDSLTPAGGKAPDYLAYMRYNVNALVDNLTRAVH